MAHHGEGPGFDPEIRKLLDAKLAEEIGPTRRHPEGKLTERDEGEIQFGVTVKDGKVVMAFGTPVDWLGMNPDQAQELGMLLIKNAAKARGEPVTIRIGRD